MHCDISTRRLSPVSSRLSRMRAAVASASEAFNLVKEKDGQLELFRMPLVERSGQQRMSSR